MKKGFRILAYILLPLFTAIFIVGDIIAYQNNGVITAALGGQTASFEGEEADYAAKMGDDLCREIEEEGIVLLKNAELDDGTLSLPLKENVTKVNVFGWGSTQFLQKGVGSGSSSINPDRSINFLQALEQYGISYNKSIASEYTRFSTADILKKNTSDDYKLYQPTLAWHQRVIEQSNAKTFSDTALLVIHRVGGENIGEIPVTQTLVTESGTETDSSRTYLQISKHEEDLINLLSTNFENVVLILNTTNSMHLPILNSDKIDSCIYVGITGQSGAASIPNVLWGRKKISNGAYQQVSPSGKLTDIYSYTPNTSPSFANYIHSNNHIQYLEDIYYGYKWYETADAEGYWDDISNSYGTGYDGVVQFPFGFGLSYTKFEWSNMQTIISTGSEINKDTKVTVQVTVKNKGDYPAKDVVELYVSPSYKDGEIEKPSIMLVDFAKTRVLGHNEEQTVEMSFDLYDIASYDCYDDNNNTFRGYEVDYGLDGQYIVKLMTDSHTPKNMGGGVNSYTLQIPQEGIKFENDNVTNHEVSNRMTGVNAYAGVPVDGGITSYMTRADFRGTFPNSHASTNPSEGAGPLYYSDYFFTPTMPNTNPVDSGLRIATLEDGTYASLEQLSGKTEAKIKANEELIAELSNYDSITWDKLLNQMSIDDICDLVENGGFHTYPIESIGKPRAFDTDGPAGFNLNTVSIGDGDATKWTAYPSETLIGCTWNKELAEKMGLCMGMEAQATKVQGWYAPGVNLHRTPYTARNYEYYSEDAVLSGVFAANVIKGAKTNGLYCYLKHFVLSEPGPNPRKLNTWCTEQNLRENYLKPFEIAVKKGEANGIMSAFNRVGSVWAGANFACLQQILRDEWGFKGSVITDYAMTNDVGNMNPDQGVRACNDLWLNPNDGTISNPLHRDDATVVNAARHAAKNIIYTYIDTYFYGTHHTAAYEGYDANVSMSIQAAASAWWIPTLIITESVIMAGLVTYFVFALVGGIKIYNNAHPQKEKVKREPQPLYITKRLKKVIMFSMLFGGLGAILLVVLIPLFDDILVNHNNTNTVIPVDVDDVFENKFEFENGIIEATSVNEDHLCYGESFFYNMNLSSSGAITKLNKDSKISYRFVSSKSYRTSMNIRMAAVYDELTSSWKETNLKDYLTIMVNNQAVNLDNIKIPASNRLGILDNYTGFDMNMVNVIGIPVTLSNISNTYEFIIKEGCPALDSFSIYTSADIDDIIGGEEIDNVKKYISLKEVPNNTSEGKVEIACNVEKCTHKHEYNIPLLTGKKYYTYKSENNSYTFDTFGRKYVITPDTADSPVGAVHSECKDVRNFKGDNFFEAQNWNYQSSTSQTAANYVRKTEDIIDAEGNVVLTDKTYSKTNIFYCDSAQRRPLVDYNTAANKDYLGKKMEYSFLVNATGGFELNAFGMVYSDAALKVKNSVPGVYFKFTDDGLVKLTIGNNSSSGKNSSNFRTPVDFISTQSHLEFNVDTWIKFEFTRYTPSEFELTLYINDQKVELPTMPSSSTGNLANRYTENGSLYIIQTLKNEEEGTEDVYHTWGEYLAIAPNTGTIFTFKDVNYSVGK